MKTSYEMLTFCVKNKFMSGIGKSEAQNHFSIIAKNLLENEDVKFTFIGLHNYISLSQHDYAHAYAVTESRILVARKKIMGENFYSYSKSQLNDISASTKMLSGIIIFNTVGRAFNVYTNKDTASKILTGVRNVIFNNQQQSASAQPPAQPPAQYIDLRELKSLLDDGIITQDDYDAKKHQLLGV